MEVVRKSVYIIDYVNETVKNHELEDAFDDYIIELIAQITGNNIVRGYKTRSCNTEVISCIRSILTNNAIEDIVQQQLECIAKRLLLKEIEAQKIVARLNQNIQKGSLLQALIYDEETQTFKYLLAKVEHSKFFDDADFSLKSGFPRDRKNIWKTCIYDIPSAEESEYTAQIYSDNVAKYWYDEFLELTEMKSDEFNTERAFKSINVALNKIKKNAPQDYTIMRNSVISYFKNHKFFSYDEMLESLFENYVPVDLSQESLNVLRNNLGALPDKNGFDRQFVSIPERINTRIKKTYEVNQGIEIKITDEVPDMRNTIMAYRSPEGNHYLILLTNNQETFCSFRIIEEQNVQIEI